LAGEKPRSVVLLSGGMDSCVCAALAARDTEAAALHVNYGQRTAERERWAFERICDFLGIKRRLVIRNEALGIIGGSALTDKEIAVPEASEEIGLDIPITYVPFSNSNYLSAAVSSDEVLYA
jgi:7-cyano-7-deazaguanine synthase